MNNRMKKQSLLVIFIWILFLAAAGIACTALQASNLYEKTKKELADQTEIVSGQFASLVDTNFYVRAALQERLISEIKAISYVLENYDDIDQASDFLEDITNTTEIKKLWICDKNGNVLFKSAAASESKPDPDYISTHVPNEESYEKIESAGYDESDRYQIITYYLKEDSNDLLWSVNDRWYIYTEDILSDTVKNVIHFFDWDQVLQDISVGRDGVVLAVSESDGSVLSYSDPSAKGKPVEALNITIGGEKEPAGVGRLEEVFSNTCDVSEIRLDSVPYYASRMSIDHDLFLMMFPAKTVENLVWSEAVILMVPLALITGIGILYVFCLAGSVPKQPKKGSKKKKGQTVPLGKVKVCALLSVSLMLVISLYLETQLVYARMFQYTSTTADDVMQKKNDSDEMLKEVQAWIQDGNLEKCRIAKCSVQHAPEGKPDRQYVADLADCLDVNNLYVFDKWGNLSLTSAPYDRYFIDKNSPFHALLEGEDHVVVQPDQEDNPGETQQETGVTMIDDDHMVEGAVVAETDALSTIPEELSYEAVFQRVFLKDNTVVMAINSENMTVQYFAQVDGSLLVSDQLAYDYSQADAAALGIDENLIRDHFNGEIFAIDNQFFASIRRNDNAFLMVLRPLVFLDAGNILSVILVTGFCLLFFILLILVTGRFNKVSEEDAEEMDDQASEEKNAAPDISKDSSEDDVFALLGKLADNEKWGFEERWPTDGKKWRDKAPIEKFSTAVKLICITALVLIAVHIAVAGENSILYYCFNGEWSSGVNLYSITSCIITVIVLILLREIIHKILYLIARAAKSRGETICHLLSSFTGYILFFTGIFIILGTLGVNVAAMSLTAGVAGIIFGIGCQNIVADILAGIIMAFEGVACAGDFVSYNGHIGAIQSIGVRTTKIKYFGEIMIVRNNEFKNFVNMPAEDEARVVVKIGIDLKESITRVESIIDKELPLISERLSETVHENINVKYRGVQDVEENAIKLSFGAYGPGMYYGWVRRLLNRELLLMCERNEIRLAMPQVVINMREGNE